MAYTKKTLKNLTGGVSQQPDELRYDNQCTEQINFLSDPVKGLTKRAGTIYEQWISSTTAIGGEAASEYIDAPTQNTFTHIINRSDGERLLLVVSYKSGNTGGKMELFKLNEDGVANEELTITGLISGGDDHVSHAYLLPHVAGVSQPLSAVTIADHTFITNNQVTPALTVPTNLTQMSGMVEVYGRPFVKRGMIYVKEGAYSSAYIVKATDANGIVRTIDVETSAGVDGIKSRRDMRTDQITGAIYFALINWNEDENPYSTDAEGMLFGNTYYSAVMANYTDEDTTIRITWSDDSTNFLWNSIGHMGGSATLRGGSNFDSGMFDFRDPSTLVGTNPTNNQKIRLVGADSSNTELYYQFTTDGVPSDAAYKNVDIESSLTGTLWNLMAAINENTATTGLRAYEHSLRIIIHSTIDGSVNAAARDSAIHHDAGLVGTRKQMAGAVSDPSAATSQGSTHTRIYFQRQYSVGSKTTGSVISWYAMFATEEEAENSLINIEITDSYGDSMTEVYGNTIDSITSLPTVAPNNFSLKVEGDKENDSDDHYLKFVCEGGERQNQTGTGKWEESLKDGLPFKIDADTMPHQLVKVNDTTYKFQKATWANKIVGDENSDVAPSFIGHPIRDVFHHKSRLGFLAGESVILSEVDNAENFWSTSVIDSSDSDRIDISSSANEITYLNWAIPFANELVVFSDNAQFLLTQGSQGLTPSTAALSLGSTYASSNITRPIVTNDAIIFAQKKSNSSELYEMRARNTATTSFEALSMCEHVPTYIEGEIVNISASSSASTIVVQTDADDNKLYVYNYKDVANRGRVQSAWSKYELACNHIKFGGFIAERFHLIEGHWTGNSTETVDDCLWVLTHMNFDNTDSLTHAVDCAWSVPLTNPDTGSSTMAHAGGVTTITAEWQISNHTNRVNGKLVVFDSTTNVTYPVTAYNASTGSRDNLVLVTGNIASNANIVLGMKYPATYEFSKQYIKRGSADGREVAITDGRTTNKWVEIYFNDTQHLTATIAYPSYLNRASSSKTFTGNPDNTITGTRTGEQPSETDSLRTSVAARSDLPIITLSSETHQTVTITGASFELMHTSRISRTS